MRIKARFQRYTGYLNFINDPMSHVLLLILVHVLLHFHFLPHCNLNHVIKYSTTVYESNGKNLFWSIKNSGEILYKLKIKRFSSIWFVYIWFLYSLYYVTS